MVKSLVVYYSLTGNTKLIAEAIKDSLNSEILELKPEKELNADGSMKYFWGGFQATMRMKPKLETIKINPLDYDLIFIGSPVWAWRQSPPINSFLEEYDFSGKNIALWMCAAGNGVKAMDRFKKEIKDADILGEICFTEPLQNDPEQVKTRVKEWSKIILQKLQN
jgi:flavodoxin